jgi:flagellar basal-body rod protein FlgG
MRSLSIAATGMLAQQLNVDVISNNIANLSTTGFKRQRAEFQDLIYQNIQRSGTTSSDNGNIVPTGIQIGTGVKPGAIYRIHQQGNVVQTGNELDLAIQGKGYFQVQLPSGDPAYMRAGALQINNQGQVVTAQGYIISPNITIPSDAVSVSVNQNGEVRVKFSNQSAEQLVGQFDLVNFQNEAGLQALGDNLYQETDASGSPLTSTAGQPGYGTVLQGYLETSNVDVVTELTTLITAQRSYEMNSKIISTSDEMLRTVSQLSA